MNEGFKNEKDHREELVGIRNGIIAIAIARFLEGDCEDPDIFEAWEAKYLAKANKILDEMGDEALLEIERSDSHEIAAENLLRELGKV